MKIGIDISQIVYGTGVSQYTRNLVNALLAIDKKNEYMLFGGALHQLNYLNHLSREFKGKVSRKFYPLAPTILDLIWNRFHKFPIENFVGDIDIFHSSDWVQPPARRARLVTTIHDLVPLLYPAESHPKIVAAHKARLAWVKKEVDMVITVSESTKKDIVENLGIPGEKISVVYEAPDPSVKKMGDRQVGEIRKKYNLPKKYLLAVGANPRKNIQRIAQATSKINDAPPLVVIGRKWGAFILSEQNESKGNILWLGHIPIEDLPALYTGALTLVYASLYEGFGLPILEAMACGCPVVTSNISSMPEISGEAAILVDPTDVKSIACGIEKALVTRSDLVKKGLARVKQFSWEKAARGTLKVYQEVANL